MFSGLGGRVAVGTVPFLVRLKCTAWGFRANEPNWIYEACGLRYSVSPHNTLLGFPLFADGEMILVAVEAANGILGSSSFVRSML